MRGDLRWSNVAVAAELELVLGSGTLDSSVEELSSSTT